MTDADRELITAYRAADAELQGLALRYSIDILSARGNAAAAAILQNINANAETWTRSQFAAELTKLERAMNIGRVRS